MRMLWVYILLALCLSAQAIYAQNADTATTEYDDEEPVIIKPNMNDTWKTGVKLGSGFSQYIGAEAKNSYPCIVLNGGAYLRYRTQKKWSFQQELNISYRGSYFDNKVDELWLLRSYWLDATTLAAYGINTQKSIHVLFGTQYSHLITSFLFVKKNSANIIPENNSPAITKNVWLGVVGMQFQTPFVGFQVLAKYGFTNLNDGLLPGIKPLNQGKNMNDIMMEVNILF
jgi:hypothetical protein